MALASSGPLTFSSIQGEYGGANPINISEYYRNGAYVPNSITTTSYYWAFSGPSSVFLDTGSNYWTKDGTSYQLFLNGSLYYSTTSNFFPFQVYFGGIPSPGPGVSYVETTFGSTFQTIGSVEYKAVRENTYSSVQLSNTTTTLANQNVPTSGIISVSNFYNGRKT